MLAYTYVQTVCTLACVPLLFLNCDTKCYGPNWVVRGMLSPILSLSVPSVALQARGEGLGPCALLPSVDQFGPFTLQMYGSQSVCGYKNRLFKGFTGAGVV